MLSVTRASAAKDWAEFTAAWEELLCSTLRNLMLITDAFCLIVIVVLAGNSPTPRMAQFFVVAVVLILPSLLAHRLLERHYIAVQVVWQAGLVAGVTTAALLLEQSEIALMYALLPLISAIAGGWPAGLLTECVILVLTWVLTQVSFAPPLSTVYGWAIVVAGAFTGVLGWTATNTLLTVTQWSLFSFNQARQNLEEARDQAVILKQTQEDLVQANRGLARLSGRLNVMQRIAEEARQAKAEFVANVSHELRTPLNMIIGFADVISQSSKVYGVKLPPVLLTDIAAIQRNSQHLSNLGGKRDSSTSTNSIPKG